MMMSTNTKTLYLHIKVISKFFPKVLLATTNHESHMEIITFVVTFNPLFFHIITP
jgi:hypothetical protein